MKLIITKNKISNAENFLRKAGYGFIHDRQSNKESFVRRLSNYHYPRLHMYVNETNEKITFNLHLDQKKASYQGSKMHSAEYDSPLVEKEINRLKNLALSWQEEKDNDDNNDSLEKKDNKKNSWWKFWAN